MTRVIAGKFKGKNLTVPDDNSVRPTTDMMRGRIFSMLQHHRYPAIAGARVADLYAGTGALGIEALSRGADHATLVELSAQNIKNIRSNIKKLDASVDAVVQQWNAVNLPPITTPFDIIFMDPPYGKDMLTPTLESIIDGNWLATDGVIVCELDTKDKLDLPQTLTLIDDRKQGRQKIAFISFATAAV